MRIGELARRTGASGRSLRYYESRSLLTSRRMANGYRDFEDDQVALVRTIANCWTPG
jgi:DNA-binding transcriptional MerR regulator